MLYFILNIKLEKEELKGLNFSNYFLMFLELKNKFRIFFLRLILVLNISLKIKSEKFLEI